MIDLIPGFVLPFFLYAETHYKFKGIYSRLLKNEPEIVADAPFRVEPHQPIPVLLLVKDAHWYPVQLLEIIVRISSKNQPNMTRKFPLNITLNKTKFWSKIFLLEPLQDVSGIVDIDVQIIVKVNGKVRVYHNDNYRISSHQPLQVYLASEMLPRFDNWYFGDFHYHSNYTEDQVEFGAPLAETVQIAQAMGLNFFAVTDHSYDLDDYDHSWVHNDQQVRKWHRLWDEVEQLNRKQPGFIILPGEEVSVANSRNQNVHLLVLNHRNFLPGKGDSAERWFHTRPDLSITRVLDQISGQALAIAGHPEMPTPWLQRLLIRRGGWHREDFQHPKLDGFQIWNGEEDQSFSSGSKNWVRLLLRGKRLSLIAGNDAHGNFNRFRQIGFPFFTMRESNDQIFGKMRTGVLISQSYNLNSLVRAVKRRHVIVSNGPVVRFSIENETGAKAKIGDEIQGQRFTLSLDAKSTDEFGKLESIQLFHGDLLKRKESCKIIKHFVMPYTFHLEQVPVPAGHNGYFRVELTTRTSTGKICRCMTNPIWLKNMSDETE